MSFETPNAYLPSDLLDSDDEVAENSLGMKNYIVNNILDDDDQPTADNSSNGNNSSTENSSIFSV